MKKINIDDYIELLDEETILLEPRNVFDKGIIGYTEDRCHIVYSLELLVDALAESYTESENPTSDAIEWLDYNTIRSLPYMDNEHRPILMTNGEF